jgi:hypothetical protein
MKGFLSNHQDVTSQKSEFGSKHQKMWEFNDGKANVTFKKSWGFIALRMAQKG